MLLAGALVLLTACSSAVKVAPFEGAERPECHAVAEQWPLRVGSAEPRETAVDSVTVAAWGDPAIIARCGAQPPGPTTEQCLDIAGVDWVVGELDDGVSFTTFGRDPALEVLVPDAYDTPPLLMPVFAEAAQVIDQGERRCT